MVRALVVVMTVGVLIVSMPGCADDSPGDNEPPAGVTGEAAPDAAGSDGAVAPAVVAASVDATRALQSARVELQTAYRGLASGTGPGVGAASEPAGGGTSARLVQRAAFDHRSQRAEAEMDMSELAAVLDDADEAVPGDYSRPTRVVVADGTVYTQIGPIAAEVGLDPATWVARDLASLADRPVENDTMALLVQPLGMLDLLRLPIGSVRMVEEGEVRGERALHLAVTVDLAGSPSSGGAPGAAGRGVPGGARGGGVGEEPGGPPFEEAIDARLRHLGLTELPVDVWLGADGLVRRVEFSIDGAGSPGGLTTTFDVYDVGEPIAVDVPEGPDVIDQDELRSRVLSR